MKKRKTSFDQNVCRTACIMIVWISAIVWSIWRSWTRWVRSKESILLSALQRRISGQIDSSLLKVDFLYLISSFIFFPPRKSPFCHSMSVYRWYLTLAAFAQYNPSMRNRTIGGIEGEGRYFLIAVRFVHNQWNGRVGKERGDDLVQAVLCLGLPVLSLSFSSPLPLFCLFFHFAFCFPCPLAKWICRNLSDSWSAYEFISDRFSATSKSHVLSLFVRFSSSSFHNRLPDWSHFGLLSSACILISSVNFR